MRSTEGSPKWENVGGDFADRVLLHLATDPTDPDRLYAVSQDSAVLQSLDGGRGAVGGGEQMGRLAAPSLLVGEGGVGGPWGLS